MYIDLKNQKKKNKYRRKKVRAEHKKNETTEATVRLILKGLAH